MQAYLNSPDLKAQKIAHMKAHIAADHLVRGTGWGSNGVTRGCAVGCTFDSYDHSLFEPVLGIPEWAGRMIDHLHENTSKDYLHAGRPIALAFLEAIKPGADLTKTEHLMHIFIQQRNLERVRGLKISDALKAQVLAAIQGVLDVRQKAFDFGWNGSAADSAAYSAADSAYSARAAAYLAADSACSAYSAYSAARVAYATVYSAVYSAGYSAYSAYSAAARSAENDIIADEFIRLLEAA